MDPVKRFFTHVRKSGGHWLWQSATRDGVYGAFKVDGAVVLAHRWIYEQLVGPIGCDPETGEPLTLDHVAERCGITRCVNPACMEPVTRPENSHREAVARRRRAA
jgi:hypothetical protein